MSERPNATANGVTWITGASSGLGYATALELLRRGQRVALTARRADLLQKLAAPWPGQAYVYPCDVTDREAVRRTVAAIENDVGPIMTALLNAGGNSPPSAGSVNADDFQTAFALNFFGVLHGIESLLPFFRSRKRGHLALVASVAGYRGLPNTAPYCSSKAALINLAETLRLDLRHDNIKVQLICPGFIKTPLTDRNRFPMPFLMPVERAATRLADALKGNAFEITFPRRFTWLMKLVRILPDTLYFAMLSRVPGGWRKDR